MKDQKQLFSIRKFKRGASSVVIASLFFIGLSHAPALADTEPMTDSSEQKSTEQATNQEAPATKDAIQAKSTAETNHAQEETPASPQAKKHRHQHPRKQQKTHPSCHLQKHLLLNNQPKQKTYILTKCKMTRPLKQIKHHPNQ
nr:YSIRK-type signal peptide-containing protein [Staphylococcus pseudintermedius]